MTASGHDKVLVTGAAGFIGSTLCRQLAALERPLVTLTGRAPPRHPQPARQYAVASFGGDLRDPDILGRALAGVDTVFHLAGVAHVDRAEPAELEAINVEGSRQLALAARESGVRRLVYFSSSQALAAEQGLPAATAYGQSKLRAEQVLEGIAATGGPQLTILRPVNVYGVGMKGNLVTLVDLIRRRLLPPLPRLHTRVSLVGVDDLCRAAILAAASERANGGTYLVTDGVEYPLNHIEAAVYRALGRKMPSWRCPRVVLYAAALAAESFGRLGALAGRQGHRNTAGAKGNGPPGLRSYHNLSRDSLFSNRRICDELGFNPAATFYDELPAILDWLAAGRSPGPAQGSGRPA